MKVPAVVVVVVVLLAAAPAAAAPEDQANDVAANVMSPFCNGVTLHDCPSQAAADLRAQIESWFREGWTRADVMAELESRYGPRIDATPDSGDGLAAWIVPIGLVIAGLIGAVALARRWSSAQPGDGSPLPPEDHALVQRELDRFRRSTS